MRLPVKLLASWQMFHSRTITKNSLLKRMIRCEKSIGPILLTLRQCIDNVLAIACDEYEWLTSIYQWARQPQSWGLENRTPSKTGQALVHDWQKGGRIKYIYHTDYQLESDVYVSYRPFHEQCPIHCRSRGTRGSNYKVWNIELFEIPLIRDVDWQQSHFCECH